MLKKPTVKFVFFLCLFLKIMMVSCALEKKTPLNIKFSPDSSTIVFSGLDEVSLFRAKEQADSLSNELISVTELTNEGTGQEKQISGKTLIKGSTLIFLPDTPFVKGRVYLVQTLLTSSFGKTIDILKSNVGRTIKRQEQILKR